MLYNQRYQSPHSHSRHTKRSFVEFQSGGASSSGWFAWYSNRLDTHPVSTKCISAGLISSVGNILAQGITYYQEKMEQENDSSSTTADNGQEIASKNNDIWKDFSVDPAQVGRFAFLNAIFVAPVLHHWYNFINRALPGKSVWRVVQRTFWDEFVFSPLYIPVFLAGLWKLEGTSWPKIKSMVVKEVPGIIVAEWILWVPTMLVTFRYAPVKFQVLVINVVGVAWQTFLSFMAAHAHRTETEHTEKTNEEVSLYLESVVGTEAAHKGCGPKHQHPPGDSSSSSTTASPDVKATSPDSK
jgi:hypothetical protein